MSFISKCNSYQAERPGGIISRGWVQEPPLPPGYSLGGAPVLREGGQHTALPLVFNTSPLRARLQLPRRPSGGSGPASFAPWVELAQLGDHAVLGDSGGHLLRGPDACGQMRKRSRDAEAAQERCHGRPVPRPRRCLGGGQGRASLRWGGLFPGRSPWTPAALGFPSVERMQGPSRGPQEDVSRGEGTRAGAWSLPVGSRVKS